MMVSDDHIVGERSGSGTQAIERALAVLRIIGEGAVTTQKVAERATLPRSTALRLLQALERERFAVRRGDGTWGVGPAVTELAARVDGRPALLDAARVWLERLVERFQETAILCVREGLESVCLDKLEGPQPMRFTVSVGTRTPLHAGATARTLLAFAPRQVVEDVLQRSPHRYTQGTITDAGALQKALERVRRNGFGYSEGEIDVGAFAVAAPVRGVGGDVVAALALAGPVARMTRSLRAEVAAALIDAAQAVSAALSGATYANEMEGE
jgi:DNA-binding IclR family transcriptional regulator